MTASLVQLRIEGLHILQAKLVRENRLEEEYLEALEPLVLLVHPLPQLHLLHLLVVSSQLTWTVTMSLHIKMTLICFSGGVTTN